jgi:hypothetical protein
MKRIIAHTLAGLMLTVLGMSMAASAETMTVIKVNIPFEFTFGDQSFPAGDYSLTQPEQHVLTLRNARGQSLDSVLTDGIDSPTPGIATKVKFITVAGQHVLSEVWQNQETSGVRLAHVEARKELVESASTDSRQKAQAGQP